MKSMRNYLQPLLIVFIILFSVISVKSLFMPTQITEDVNIGEKKQTIAYNYAVYTKPSILFPQGTAPLPAGAQSYLLNVIEFIDFEIAAAITTPVGQDPAGDLGVKLFIRSDEQWQKELSVVPTITKASSENGAQFNATFKLPFREAIALGEQIVKEIDVGPQSAYKLIVQSTLLSQAGEKTEFVADYEFALGGGFIQPNGDLMNEKVVKLTQTLTSVNKLSVLWIPIKVPTARVLFPILLVFCVGLAAYYRVNLRKTGVPIINAKQTEIKKIKKKYGNRIIEVSDVQDVPDGYIQVQLHSFKDLMKVADERERPVFQLSTDHLQMANFYTVDEKTLYVFRLNMSS